MKKEGFSTKKLTTLSLLIAIALILSYIESRFEPFIPGMKVGLSNISTVFTLYIMGPAYAIIVSAIRILLMFLLSFSKMSGLIFSVCGAFLALSSMILLYKTDRFSVIVVSVIGGVSHNIGQILAACFLTKTIGLSSFLFILIISGTLAGVIIGVISGILITRLKKYI